MIPWFVLQTPLVKSILLLVHGAFVVLLCYLLMRWAGAVERKSPGTLPAVPFIVSVTSVFALLLAFNAGRIWSNQHEAEHSFRDSASATVRLSQFLGPRGIDAPDGVDALHRLVAAYVKEETVTGEVKPNAEVMHAIEDLRRVLIQVSATAPSPVSFELFRLFDQITEARAARLWVSHTYRHNGTWVVIFFLGFLSHLTIALVHADRPRAGLRALLIFGFATTAAYWLLLASINPFANIEGVLPAMQTTFLGLD